MSELKWTPKMEAMAAKHYTKDQLADLKSRDFTPADQARVSAAWAKIFEDLGALGDGADPASAKALAVGRRAHALIMEFTQGDPAMFKSLSGMKRDMMADPDIAAQGPGTPAHFALLGKIFAELQKRDEFPGA